MSIQFIKRSLLVVVLSGIAPFTFADDAVPVYDVDNLPSQFDGQEAAGSAVYPAPTGQSQQPLAESQTEQQPLYAGNTSRVEILQNEVQSLRGQVETLTHQLEQVQVQMKAMYTDLDKKVMSAQEARASAPDVTKLGEVDTPAVVSKAHSQARATKSTDKLTEATSVGTVKLKPKDIDPNVVEEQQTYQLAYDLIKSKKYNEAVTALQKMLVKYPSGQFAANAHYWLGELYTLTGKNAEAAAEFSTITKDFSDSPKVADAQLKIGMIYINDSKWTEAKLAFRKVVSRYPGTASAHLASEQLKQVKLAGH